MKRTVVAVLFLLLPVAAIAGDTSQSSASLRFVLELEQRHGAAEPTTQSVQIRVLDGRTNTVSTGWRLPIPVTTAVANASRGEALTSYQYQDVGMEARITGTLAPDGKVHATGTLNSSAVENRKRTASPERPIFDSFNHKFATALTPGEKTVVAEVLSPDGDVVTLSIKAIVER